MSHSWRVDALFDSPAFDSLYLRGVQVLSPPHSPLLSAAVGSVHPSSRFCSVPVPQPRPAALCSTTGASGEHLFRRQSARAELHRNTRAAAFKIKHRVLLKNFYSAQEMSSCSVGVYRGNRHRFCRFKDYKDLNSKKFMS